ncbi:hypothetical protein JYT99_00670 [bacterium AH-315-E09]|nr:hypothetical protein [bacterium AH-315-E09]
MKIEKEYEERKLKKLKKYMLEEYGVTPENIDRKLKESKKEFHKDWKAIKR